MKITARSLKITFRNTSHEASLPKNFERTLPSLETFIRQELDGVSPNDAITIKCVDDAGNVMVLSKDNIRGSFQVERGEPLHLRVSVSRSRSKSSAVAVKPKEYRSISSIISGMSRPGEGEEGEGDASYPRKPPLHKRQLSADTIDTTSPGKRGGASNGHRSHSGSHGRSSRKMVSPRAHATAYATRPAVTSHPDAAPSSGLNLPKSKSRHQHRPSEPPPPYTRRGSAGSNVAQKRPKSQQGMSPNIPIIVPVSTDHPYYEHYAQDVDDDDSISVVDMPVGSSKSGGTGPATRPRQNRSQRRDESKTAPRGASRSHRSSPRSGVDGHEGSRSRRSGGGDRERRRRRNSAPRRVDDKRGSGSGGSRSHSRESDARQNRKTSGIFLNLTDRDKSSVSVMLAERYSYNQLSLRAPTAVPKRRERNPKFTERLLVIANVRLFVLKVGTRSPSILVQAPLVLLEQVVVNAIGDAAPSVKSGGSRKDGGGSDDSDGSGYRVVLKFSREEIHVDVKDFEEAATIVDVLWASSQRMMVTFPLKACATFDVPEEFVVERAPEEITPEQAVTAGYTANCDFHQVPENIDIVKNLVLALDTRGPSNRINLGKIFVARDTNSSKKPFSLLSSAQLQAVSDTLAYSDLFTEVFLRNFPLLDRGMDIVAKRLFRLNKSIMCFYLDNARFKRSGAECLADGLEPHPKIKALSISSNKIGNSGLKYISHTLSNTLIERLDVSSCDISGGSGIRPLLTKFLSSEGNMMYLKQLNVSCNVLSKSGSTVLAKWLKEVTGLEVLNASHCNLELERVFKALNENKHLSSSALQSMNFGRHRLTLPAAKQLGPVLRSSGSLQHIFLPGTSFAKGAFAEVLAGLFANRNDAVSRTVDLSDCDLKKKGAAAFKDALAKVKVKNITSLILNSNNFQNEGLEHVAAACKHIPSLSHLDLDANFLRKKKMPGAAGAICSLVLDNRLPELKFLSAAGRKLANGQPTALRDEVVQIFNALRRNMLLRVLDVSNNCISEQAFAVLASAIGRGGNRSLRIVHLDENNITVEGLKAIALAMVKNPAIINILPAIDVRRLARKTRKQMMRDQVDMYARTIVDCCNRNNDDSPPPNAFEERMLEILEASRVSASSARLAKELQKPGVGDLFYHQRAAGLDGGNGRPAEGDPLSTLNDEVRGRAVSHGAAGRRRNSSNPHLSVEGDPELRAQHARVEFGVALTKIEDCLEIDAYDAPLPSLLIRLEKYLIKNNGLEASHIFAQPGGAQERLLARQDLDRGVFTRTRDIYVIADLIKAFFVELPTKLCKSIKVDENWRRVGVESIVSSLREPEESVFRWLLDLLAQTARKSLRNLQTASQLAHEFAPLLFDMKSAPFDPKGHHYINAVDVLDRCIMWAKLRLHPSMVNRVDSRVSVFKAVKCPDCGSSNDHGDTFCDRCGTRLQPRLPMPIDEEDGDEEDDEDDARHPYDEGDDSCSEDELMEDIDPEPSPSESDDERDYSRSHSHGGSDSDDMSYYDDDVKERSSRRGASHANGGDGSHSNHRPEGRRLSSSPTWQPAPPMVPLPPPTERYSTSF